MAFDPITANGRNPDLMRLQILDALESIDVGDTPTFTGLTVTGDFTVDTNTLHVDSANNRVGIGTTSPSVAFHASGTGNMLAYFTSTDSNAAQLRLQTDGTNRRLIGTTEADVVETQIGLETTQIVLAGATYGSPWATITATGATFPSDFTVDATTLHVDSANNRVGVGTTSPSYLLHVKEDGAVAAVASIESGDAVTTRNADLRLANLGQEWRVRNDSNKDFVVNDTTNAKTPFLIRDNAPTSSVIVAADGVADFGVGISLAGGSDLKDYKEGTWTPALSFGGGSTGITYGSRTGTYVQTGKWIYFTIQITLTNKGSSTGTAAITLPTGLSGSLSIVTDNGIAHWAKYSNMSGISSPNGRPVSASSLQLQSKGSAAISTVSNTNFTNTSSLTLVGHARLA